jgi:hypothetical protein
VEGTSPLSGLKKPPVSTFSKNIRAALQKTHAEAGRLPKKLESKSLFSRIKQVLLQLLKCIVLTAFFIESLIPEDDNEWVIFQNK